MSADEAARPPTVHLVAAEESGDALGGALMGALRRLRPDILFGGVGGRLMVANGIATPFAIDDLSIIGLGAIPRKLPLILRRIRDTAAAVVAARPGSFQSGLWRRQSEKIPRVSEHRQQ